MPRVHHPLDRCHPGRGVDELGRHQRLVLVESADEQVRRPHAGRAQDAPVSRRDGPDGKVESRGDRRDLSGDGGVRVAMMVAVEVVRGPPREALEGLELSEDGATVER